MRNRYLQNGIDGFAPHEVLEMLLFYVKPRADTNGIAHALLNTFGSFSGVLDANIENLQQVSGIGKESAVFFHLVKDCMKLYSKSKWAAKPLLSNSAEVGTYAVDMIGDQTEEGFYLICLDPSNYVNSFCKVESGSAYRANVDVRKVVERALLYRAHHIVLVHNHPAGAVSPSENDIALTKKLVKTFGEMDIPVIDHIIVGKGHFYSMAERGML
ncbi:MAG: DNA repair protein RadC [Clostridia bacterium]|nr:DNA repair protein RadC [Clostridia bacterium]